MGITRRATSWLVGLCLAALGSALLAAPAGATTYAPVDQPGPALSVPNATLAGALSCHGKLAHSPRPPILLVPGTTLTPAEFSWNWDESLAQQGWPYCTIDLPGAGMGDVQIAGEYVVYAIRTMYAAAGEKIDIVGHSQGGMVPRWALRFWPDTRAMVDDLVGLSPSNHGTVDADALCNVGIGCAPSIWQQQDDSHFLAALNSGQETFPGISYTNIYTDTDEVVVPNLGPAPSSALHGGGGQITNVAIQQLCPLDLTEHIGIGTYDNTAYQIAMDALLHAGPADLNRVSRTACLSPLQPGVNDLSFPESFAAMLADVGTTLASYPHVSAEPALASYVYPTQSQGR